MKKVRLDKYLSNNSKFSRSEIKKLIRSGKAKVNGVIITQSDYTFDPDETEITLDGQNIQFRKYVYLMLNKPSGILSASNDKNRKTVVDLLPDEYRHLNLFPVGRLDKDTTGLLLLTNDGDFAHKIISPKSNIEKSYLAYVDDVPNPSITEKFKQGIVLADGTVCKSATAEICSADSVRIILTEGKYHQIKRMLGVVGLGVTKLHRERIGKLELPKSLEIGQFKEFFVNDLLIFFPEIFGF